MLSTLHVSKERLWSKVHSVFTPPFKIKLAYFTHQRGIIWLLSKIIRTRDHIRWLKNVYGILIGWYQTNIVHIFKPIILIYIRDCFVGVGGNVLIW